MDEEDVALLQAPLFTTPSPVTLSPHVRPDDYSRDLSEQEPPSVVTTPSHILTPSFVAIWTILGLEPMTDDFHPLPFYSRARELRDPAAGEPPLERVLFNDDRKHNTHVGDRQGRSKRKKKKGKHN